MSEYVTPEAIIIVPKKFYKLRNGLKAYVEEVKLIGEFRVYGKIDYTFDRAYQSLATNPWPDRRWTLEGRCMDHGSVVWDYDIVAEWKDCDMPMPWEPNGKTQKPLRST